MQSAEIGSLPFVFSSFQVAPAGVIYEREFLALVASVEALSSHALAQAVCDIAHKNNFSTYPTVGFNEFPGMGLGAAVQIQPGAYRAVVIGSRQFILDQIGLAMPETLEAAARRWESKNEKISLAGWDGWVRGVMKFTPST